MAAGCWSVSTGPPSGTGEHLGLFCVFHKAYPFSLFLFVCLSVSSVARLVRDILFRPQGSVESAFGVVERDTELVRRVSRGQLTEQSRPLKPFERTWFGLEGCKDNLSTEVGAKSTVVPVRRDGGREGIKYAFCSNGLYLLSIRKEEDSDFTDARTGTVLKTITFLFYFFEYHIVQCY